MLTPWRRLQGLEARTKVTHHNGTRTRKIVALAKNLTLEDKIVFAYLHRRILKDKQVRDIDIAVWLTPGTNHIDYVVELGLKIELEIGIPIDTQVLNNAPTAFKYIVCTSRKPLIIRNKLLTT